jgi:hypothetical protein
MQRQGLNWPVPVAGVNFSKFGGDVSRESLDEHRRLFKRYSILDLNFRDLPY